MLRELLSIFRENDPLAEMGKNFTRMLEITRGMVEAGGRSLGPGEPAAPGERSQVYEQDVEVNRLERAIRQQVLAHLAVGAHSADLPYCLALLGLIKDVERVGDYAKNLTELTDIDPRPLPEDELTAELRELRGRIEAMFASATRVFEERDRERAHDLIRGGRADALRCDALLTRVARGSSDAATTTVLVLGLRYYKRIGGHLLNLLSSVVMPLHMVDFFDEDPAAPGKRGAGPA